MEAGEGGGAENEQTDIIIVGGGICGLATALAFHRKGIENVVVLEKSDTLRATGALDQLGVAAKLRNTAVPISNMMQYVELDNGKRKEVLMGVGETQCLRRSDLLRALADDLPLNTIRFRCNVSSLKLDPFTSFPNVEIDDGNVLQAKVVIGCDGVNSAVANFLGMKTTRLFSTCVVRGFTPYPSGHKFQNKFVIIIKGSVRLGKLPINRNLVYWFITRHWTSQDSMVSNDSKLIKQSSIETITGFPQEELEMIRKSNPDHLFLTPLRYRAPWNLLLRRRFGEGSVAVVGDAMHTMGPFLKLCF